MKNSLMAGSFLLLCTTVTRAQTDPIPIAMETPGFASITNDKGAETQELIKADKGTRRMEKGVSYQSNQEFMRDFPDATDVTWNLTKNFEEATFTSAGTTMTAYYDVSSQLVGTTVDKSFNDIPLKGQEYIKKHYSQYTPEKVILFDDNEENDTDMTLYDKTFEDEDNYFAVLQNDKEAIILKIDPEGAVSFFKKI